jgi:acetyl-CoA acetyltransferase
VTIAHYLGLTSKWVERRLLVHDPCAVAAIASGLCETVLITHGESGRSGVGRTRNVVAPTSLAGQFEQPYGPMGPPTLFTIPVLRYMKTYGLTHEQLAMVSVVQREWAAKNQRATFKAPITVEDVLKLADDRLPVPAIALLSGNRWRRRLDPGRGRARPRLPAKAGLPPRHRRERRDPDGQPNGRFHLFARLPRRRSQGLCRGRHHPNDVDHLMIYDAFAHLLIYGLEDLGFVPRGEAGAFIAERNTAPGGKLPLNTNGGGLSYMHSGMYGMYALQESVRQMRGTASAQIPGAKISVCHGVGGMFAASGTIIMANEAP